MRILVTGASGQIGFELVRALQPLGSVIASGRDTLDLADPGSILGRLDRIRPDLIINAAAYTAVDDAETHQALAMRVNAESPAAMAAWAASHGCALIHYSTDYVYSGNSTWPWRETDAAEPLSVYGRSKLAGDVAIQNSGAAHLILRTGWVYSARGRNFMRTVLAKARSQEELMVVNDQWGAPTWAQTVALATAAIIARAGGGGAAIAARFADAGGVFHAACAGRTTWFDFAARILERVPDPQRRLRRLLPVSSEAYGAAAARPKYSVLDESRIEQVWGVVLPAWELALEQCLAEARSDDLFMGA